MKLTKNQKHFLKTIKNKSNRKYQKQQFKLQNEFENRQIIKQFPFPIVDISFKEEFEKINGKGFPWYKHSTKEAEERFNELAKKYIPEENESTQKISCEIKSDQILSREKPKGIELNKEFLQETLDKSDDLKLCQDLKNICVKLQDYEYASKFRQKEKDILDNLDKKQFKTEPNSKMHNFPFPMGNPISDIDFHLRVFDTVKDVYKKLEERKEKLSELPFKKSDFSSVNLSDLQIEKVVEWMNTWEQLKDTAIPIRFKEDFRIKKQ